MKQLLGVMALAIGAVLVLNGPAWSDQKGKGKKDESKETVEMAAKAKESSLRSIHCLNMSGWLFCLTKTNRHFKLACAVRKALRFRRHNPFLTESRVMSVNNCRVSKTHGS